MRLSTAKDRDDAHSLAVLRAALDAGVTLFDTADAYCRDDSDAGHNERLLAQAIAGRDAFVVTKGGLVRPDGAWVPNGHAKHLDAAARASRDRLGRIDLYLLHAVDPKVPLATSVRALAKLRDRGVARGVGLSNVGLHQLEQALAITAIDGIEIELGPFHLDAIRSGLLAACKQRGIRVLAHRPFGGPAGVKRIARDELLVELARKLGATPHEIVLAWLRRLGTVPLPGATRIESARSISRVAELDADSAEQLDRHFVAIAEQPRTQAARSDRDVVMNAAPPGDREVVMIVGMPAAGKTTLAHVLAARGYVRLNRDERGGTLLELARVLDRELAAGAARVVLDNTYGTRALRAPVVEVAKRHDVPVRCLVAATTLEQAQANAVARILDLHGRLLEPAELRQHAMIGPSAQFRYRREYEPPRADEGFATIENVDFVTRRCKPDRTDELSRIRDNPALVVELDDVVWKADRGARTMFNCCQGFATNYIDGATQGSCSPARRGLRHRRWTRSSSSCSACRSRSRAVCTRRVHRSAGAASRCPGSRCCSHASTVSISRAASTSAKAPPIAASRCARDCVTSISRMGFRFRQRRRTARADETTRASRRTSGTTR
jgi:aryl-alcohol dehydrogenase-like predicted oxidoreductase